MFCYPTLLIITDRILRLIICACCYVDKFLYLYLHVSVKKLLNLETLHCSMDEIR